MTVAGLLSLIVLAVCSSQAPPPLRLTDLGGTAMHPFSDSRNKAVCLIFTLSECPVANSYAPEIKRLGATYRNEGIPIYLVYEDPESDLSRVMRHAKSYGFSLAAQDAGNVLAKRFGITRSPEAAVVLRNGTLAYRGRIDDTYSSWGVRRAKPTNRDLRNALSAIRAGKKVQVPTTPVVGCVLNLKS